MHHDTQTLAGRRILVVDNDPLIRLGTVFMLRETGYTVSSAEGADQALAMLADAAAPDLLITDYAMPGDNGVTLARKACALHKQLKVLVVTGHATLKEPIDPAWGMLGKPFTGGELHDAIAGTMRRAG